MYEHCSDISPNWMDMQSKFGYITLYEISGIKKLDILRKIEPSLLKYNDEKVRSNI